MSVASRFLANPDAACVRPTRCMNGRLLVRYSESASPPRQSGTGPIGPVQTDGQVERRRQLCGLATPLPLTQSPLLHADQPNKSHIVSAHQIDHASNCRVTERAAARGRVRAAWLRGRGIGHLAIDSGRAMSLHRWGRYDPDVASP